MLLLFETPAGYGIFKVLDENKLSKTENLYKDFESPEAASKIVKLKQFEKFADTTEALAATTAAVEGKLSKSLKKLLKKYVNKEVQDQLLVADAKLGSAIKDKLGLQCVSNTSVQELMRGVRSQMDSLLAGFPKKEMTAMALGLAHSLSRYKLKFSPDKVDTMIIQAVCLLDDLDKELNNYIMRTREWYGWHFPELGKIITDNLVFVKTIKKLGMRENSATTDFNEILPEDLEEKVKEAAEISMGTEISDDDIINIFNLCDQVIELTNYRAQLYDYLTKRMIVMAPNLTTLVGELVGARLISHAGSLINLAKHPASTLQILGAEKALFRALKTKKDTPKFGLIYHSQLVGQSSTKNKGKMSRMLAAKASLATRYDALGEDGGDCQLGAAHRATLEARLRILEEGNLRRISGTGKAKAKFEKYHSKSEVVQYPAAADSTLPSGKRKFSETFSSNEKKVEEIGENSGMSKKKKKKIKHEDGENSEMVAKVKTEIDSDSPKKKKKKNLAENVQTDPEETITEEPSSEKKKKKKKKLSESMDTSEIKTEPEESFIQSAEQSGEKKKKKKKKLSESMDTSEIKTEPEESFVQSEELSSEKKKKKKSKKHTDDE